MANTQKLNINLGTVANDSTGTKIRIGGGYINTNFQTVFRANRPLVSLQTTIENFIANELDTTGFEIEIGTIIKIGTKFYIHYQNSGTSINDYLEISFIESYDTKLNFPSTGLDNQFYIDKSTNSVYYYSSGTYNSIASDSNRKAVNEIRDYYTVKAADVNLTSLDIPLRYNIAPKTHVIVEVNNDFLKNDFETPINKGVYTYIEWQSKITLFINRMFYKLIDGWRITIYYSYIDTTITNPDLINVSLESLTYTVGSDASVNIEYQIKNNGSKQITISVINQLTTWSQPETIFITIPSGQTVTSTKVFPNVDTGTYTFNLSGDVTGQITNIVIPAKVANITFGNINVNQSTDNIKFSITGTNNGSASGATNVFFKLYSSTGDHGTDIVLKTSATYSGTYTINPSQSQLFSLTDGDILPVSWYHVQAYRTDTNALIDETWFQKTNIPAPISISQMYGIDYGPGQTWHQGSPFIIRGPYYPSAGHLFFVCCENYGSSNICYSGVFIIFDIPSGSINANNCKLAFSYGQLDFIGKTPTNNMRLLESLVNETTVPLTGFNITTKYVAVDLFSNITMDSNYYYLNFNYSGMNVIHLYSGKKLYLFLCSTAINPVDYANGIFTSSVQLIFS